MNIFRDTLRLRGKDRHADRREDIEVVCLPRQECLAVIVDRRELHTGGADRFALRPHVGLLGRAFGMFGRVR